MKIEDLAGTWKGCYTYRDGYIEEFLSVKEHFTLELNVAGEILEGTVIDSYIEKYFDKPATVRGYLEGRDLIMIKIYPHYFGTDENGLVFLDPKRPSHEIHYVGRITTSWFSSRYFVEGNWDISESFRDADGNTLYYTGEGDWEMKKNK